MIGTKRTTLYGYVVSDEQSHFSSFKGLMWATNLSTESSLLRNNMKEKLSFYQLNPSQEVLE